MQQGNEYHADETKCEKEQARDFMAWVKSRLDLTNPKLVEIFAMSNDTPTWTVIVALMEAGVVGRVDTDRGVFYERVA